MTDAPVLLWAQAVLMTFIGWLLVFVPAWIFPYAWRTVGLVTGILWGVSPLVVPLWRKVLGEPNILALAWAALGLPLQVVLDALALPAGPLHGALAFMLGLGLGLAAAWTGNYFRLFH